MASPAKCTLDRVTGYYRPVANFNRGKKEEFKDRAVFKISSDMKQSDVLDKDSAK